MTDNAPSNQAPVNDVTLGHIAYGLYAAGVIVGITPIVGVILCFVKRDEVKGSLLESHFTWLIRTFLWCLLFGVVGLVLMIVGIGFLIMLATGIWYIYRIVIGWLKLSEGKPIPNPEGWI